MKLSEACRRILFGGTIEDKLTHISSLDFDEVKDFSIPNFPTRDDRIKLSKKQQKFPRGNFHEIEKKAIALHSFANHELLAIEMMACALLLYPHYTPELKRFKKGVVKSLQDEQKHFKIYCCRLNQLGYEFGDFPLRDFFWGQMHKLDTPSKYLAVMSLTFEAANLDFAHYYKHVFQELGDEDTAKILDTVLKDEIGHVHLGVYYLNRWCHDDSLWNYYNKSLPFPITPARGKGKFFIESVRKKARMSDDFILRMKQYQDDFQVTTRKEWKE